jgi:hypothetical protein
MGSLVFGITSRMCFLTPFVTGSSRSRMHSHCRRNNNNKKNEDSLRSNNESSMDNKLDHCESSHDDYVEAKLQANYIKLVDF